MSNREPPFHYRYSSGVRDHTSDYLWPPLIERLRRLGAVRVLDLGCGSGAFSGYLADNGFEVVGCDPSESGIGIASSTFPKPRFLRLGAYDDPEKFDVGMFDAVVSVEVIEHLAYPRHLVRFAERTLLPQGRLILTTPYHGYLKNLALSLSNRWDRHWSPGWDGGHVKFWSRTTLGKLLAEEGFVVEAFSGAGRIPLLWKSMIIGARRT
jgi:SAM-dependent methyltransferase